MNRLTQLIEAALFSADRPLTLGDLSKLDSEVSREAVAAALEELKSFYQSSGRGVELVELADGFQILTRSEFAEAIAQAQIVTRPRRLSPAALETLAIVAYRQPVGRAEIEEIRGVAVEGVLRHLQERELIQPVARGEGLGRPLLYGTTEKFLETLGLNDIRDLPSLDEFSVKLQPPTELEVE